MRAMDENLEKVVSTFLGFCRHLLVYVREPTAHAQATDFFCSICYRRHERVQIVREIKQIEISHPATSDPQLQVRGRYQVSKQTCKPLLHDGPLLYGRVSIRIETLRLRDTHNNIHYVLLVELWRNRYTVRDGRPNL